VKLRARWHGDPPRAGSFLMSDRPKFAYRIDAVIPSSPGRYTFEVTRLPADLVPAGALIHQWKWNPRNKKLRPHD